VKIEERSKVREESGSVLIVDWKFGADFYIAAFNICVMGHSTCPSINELKTRNLQAGTVRRNRNNSVEGATASLYSGKVSRSLARRNARQRANKRPNK
jgi:hypothetical protein